MPENLGANFGSVERAAVFMSSNRELLWEWDVWIKKFVFYAVGRPKRNPLIAFITFNGPIFGIVGNITHG